MLPPIYSNELPDGIGIFFAKNTLEEALSLMFAVIWLVVVLANVKPITTVVVDDGAVYTPMRASADVVEPSYTLFLNVLAIYYLPYATSSSNAHTITSAVEAEDIACIPATVQLGSLAVKASLGPMVTA